MIDGASLRRGTASVQRSYGVPVALCSSDYLLMAAQGYLLQEGYYRSAAEMARLVRVMCTGEVLQIMCLRGVNWLAVGAGALASTILSTTVLVYALKAIPKFDLSDINRL